MSTFFPKRTAVVSPHLDDGVLSLGAAISRTTQAGGYVRIVTVFAGDVESTRPASGWDSLSNFATEGEAVRVRREEDAEACRVLGADRACLAFSEPVYAGAPDEEAVVAAVREAVCDVDAILVPGYPLIHRDHRWVSERLLAMRLGAAIGLYAEQPYRSRSMRRVRAFPGLLPLLSTAPKWRGARSDRDSIRKKQRAICAYGTQRRWLELDGRKLARMLLVEAMRGGEAVAWVTPAASPARDHRR